MCTGMWRVAGLRLSWSSTPSPEKSGRFTSSTMAAGWWVAAIARPSAALAAHAQSKPISDASSCRICANRGSSSITSRLRAPLLHGATSAGAAGRGSVCGSATGAGAGGTACARCTGNSRVKVLPSPGVLCSKMSPPRRCARLREIDRPRPVPPYLRCVLPSAWRKASNTSACWCDAMPMPVSRTAKVMRPLGVIPTCT